MKNLENYLNFHSLNRENVRYKCKSLKARHADLENLLFEWVLSAKAQNVAITEEKLITTAKIIGEQLMISDFSYSAGWLAKFKRRFSINSKRDSELPNDNSTEIDDLVMLRNQNLAAESEGNEFIASFVTHQPISEPHESMIDMKDINEIIEAATAEESDVEEKQETKRAKISPQEALDSIKTLVSYMESSQDFAPEEVCTLFRIENKIRLKSQSTS